jgi:glycosyltransferase involved in cell wall biosynthesis
MRIAFDYQIFALQSYGGISRYFARLAEGLIDLEQQVKVFVPLHRNHYLKSIPQDIVNGSYVSQYPPKTTRFFSAYNHFIFRHKISKWQPDIVHETYYSKAGTAPRQSKTIVTVYDMIHELYPREFKAMDETQVLKRMAIERADHVICISENTKKDLIRLHGTPESKISVVLLGFDQFLASASATSSTSLETKPFLLYVGQRGSYKNFPGFLKAIAASKKLIADFDVIAFGGGRFSSAEMDLISTLGFAANQVRQVSGDDALLGRFYGAAGAFVYPSLYEGFGIPPLEAMAHLCPVISSNSSSMPEVIGDAAEFFEPNELESMRCAIENVVYSEGRISDLRIKGTARLSYFSWEKCTTQTLDIYKKVSGKS